MDNRTEQKIIFLGGDGTTELRGGLILGDSLTVVVDEDTHNFEPEGLDKVVMLRLDVQGNQELTGIVPPDVNKTSLLTVVNVGANVLSVKNEDIASLANNRFCLGSNITVQGGEGITVIYDNVDKCWRSAGKNI